MCLNPRSLLKANKNLLITLATKIAEGDFTRNPLSLAYSEIHNAAGKKHFVSFDFDAQYNDEYKKQINNILKSHKILITRGGFHTIVSISKNTLNNNWYKAMAALPECDVKGSDMLSPVPGCTQGGFCPFFLE